jgi:hypothetical protein
MGCTIMSGGWTDGRSYTRINFLVSFLQGTIFLKSIDASSRVKDAQLFLQLLDEVVVELGVENVVHVIIDNASNYVVVGRSLWAKHPTIFQTPCIAHCLDLMLEDIIKLE